MEAPALPVLWLCGPPGVGKSAVAWEILTRLAGAGISTAHVDIDQLGICQPDPPSDPGRHRIKARNLAAIIPSYGAAGARRLVVSGVVDPVRGVRPHLGALPGVELTLCRLRCDDAELARRLLGRGEPPDLLPSALEEAHRMECSDVAGAGVDTTGLSIDEVVARVLEVDGGWSDPEGLAAVTGETASPASPSTAAGPILWLCGARAVGKSTIGFRVFQDVWRDGRRAAFLDLQQVGFLRPLADDDRRRHRLRARNLAAVWDGFRKAGFDCLVVVGPVDSPEVRRVYAEAVPAAALTLCRLDAGAAELARRVSIRGAGGGPPIAGDELRGLAPEALRTAAERAIAEASWLRRSDDADLAVATDGLTVDGAAGQVVAAAGGWPGTD
jgi:adenylylsulfate kinase-like enzyme